MLFPTVILFYTINYYFVYVVYVFPLRRLSAQSVLITMRRFLTDRSFFHQAGAYLVQSFHFRTAFNYILYLWVILVCNTHASYFYIIITIHSLLYFKVYSLYSCFLMFLRCLVFCFFILYIFSYQSFFTYFVNFLVFQLLNYSKLLLNYSCFS